MSITLLFLDRPNIYVIIITQIFHFFSVSWDTPVRDIIGDWFYFWDGYRSNVTSLRDLVAHKTGVPRHDLVWHFDQWSQQELLE